MQKNKIIYTPFSDWRFTISKAQGSYLWDQSGKKLIDFTSGWNVTNLGWNHPELRKALIRQVKMNAYAPMWTSDPIQEQYANALVQSLPKGLCAIGRATSGTEANEEAIKVAKAYTGRRKMVGFARTYHGQSSFTLALGYLSEKDLRQDPMYQNFIQIEFPTITNEQQNEKELLKDFSEQLEGILCKSDVAAIITEAGIITGWGSARIAPKGFLQTIRKLTKKYGTILILDEVGTGFSRCGELYGMHLEGVIPDIVTFAKGSTNGAAVLGTMVTTKEIAEKSFEKATLISTFGWTPIACAVGLRTLQLHLELKLWERAAQEGSYLLETLQAALNNDSRVTYIAGKGMIVGVHFTLSSGNPLVTKIVDQAQKIGLHLVCDQDATIQLMPPLTIPRSVLNKGIDIFTSVIKSTK
ncbi:MAG: aspartate aminotransferase family protein [Patescibacteria group bacterium]